MENCPTQHFVLALRAPEEEWGDPVLVFEDFHVGDEALVLRAMDAWRPSAFIEGRVVAADGVPLLEVELGHVPAGLGEALSHVPDADGHFRIGPLRPGEYKLGAEAVGHGWIMTPRFALQAGETKDVGDLVLERSGWIRVRAVAPGGGELPAGTVLEGVRLLRDGEGASGISFEDLEGRSEPLSPGTYLVRARDGLWCAPDTEVEVRPAVTTELELAFEPATERCIEVVFADGVPADSLAVRVLDAHGRVLDERHCAEHDEDGRYTAWFGGLPVGIYSAEVRDSDGRSATGELRVPDLVEDDTPLVLTLR
jgi:hypothetical protein